MTKDGITIRRGISGPYTKRSFRDLTPQEIALACDGDRATQMMREQTLIHPDGRLSTMTPDIRMPRESRLLAVLKICKAIITSSMSCGKEYRHGKGKTAKHSADKIHRRSERCAA